MVDRPDHGAVRVVRLAEREPEVVGALGSGGLGVAQSRAEHGDDANPSRLECTDGQRRFDALAAIFLRAASTPADGQQPEPLVNLVIDTVTLERLLNDDEHVSPRPDDPRWWRSPTTDGTPVPPDDVIDAMIWGRVRRIVIDTADGAVIDVGRRGR